MLAGVALAGLLALSGTRLTGRTAWAAQDEPAQPLSAAARKVGVAAPNHGPEADRQAIEESTRLFMKGYEQGDAVALASLWTPQGEMRDPSGRVVQGRGDIAAAFRAVFKEQPRSKIEVLIRSIRFPAKDMAVEEGLLRQSRGVKELPVTTSYVVVHVREGGQWKIALSSEAGVGQDRLEDLDWLLGDWTTKVKDATVKLSFVRDPRKPVITATFTRTGAGKEPIAGTIRIALDPETGRIRSWGFEDDGAHSQSVWVNDGKSWLLDSRGVLADGTPTAERIVLQPSGADVITWRAIDRVLGDTPLMDTPPLRLTRSR